MCIGGYCNSTPRKKKPMSIHLFQVRWRVTARLLVILLCMLAWAGCDRKESSSTGPGATRTGAGGGDGGVLVSETLEAGVMKGTAVDSMGRPLKSFGGHASGYSLKSGQNQSADLAGAAGAYRVNLGPGQFSVRAWTDVEYNGHSYRIDLHPVDGKTLLFKHDTTPGIVKNFVWKLEGFRPGVDERSEDRYYGHYGGSIMFSVEGNGAAYQTEVLNNYSSKPEPKLRADSTIEVTLVPEGPMIDGSPGKPVVLREKPADWKGYMDRVTRGIPIGKYKATAQETTAGGEKKPLRLVTYLSFHKGTPQGPAPSITVEFIQPGPPSETVNRVEEINLHAMY